MEFKKGTAVYSSDGRDVGHVDRVVLDPRTDEVSHIVVEKGILFVTDKVVPIDLVDTATEERITLCQDEQGLGSLPDFEEIQYVEAETPTVESQDQAQEEYASPLYWYPPLGATWGGAGGFLAYSGLYGFPSPPVVVRATKNIPENAVALEEGARVVGKEGEHVGNVDEILTDPEANRVTHLVVSRGVLHKERKLIPVTWLSEVHENEICLAVAAQVVKDLGEYEPKR
jgi:uncharacterized protein YrrD